MQRVVFLDRDGVLCEDRHDYVRTLEEWRWVAGAKEGAAALAAAGWTLVVITNQSCIGKGLVTAAAVDEIHAMVLRELAAAGAPLAGIFVCPHAPSEHCSCRKPAPGLLLQAAHELDIDLAHSIFVGDAIRDSEAANSAGTAFIMVRTGQGKRWAAEAASRGLTFPVVSDLREAAAEILRTSSPRA